MPLHFSRGKNRQTFILIGVLVVAAFFRLSQLDRIPAGLWVDEAMNGVDALTALDSGDFKAFYPENNGREGLFINLQAASVKLFGPSAWSLRLVSALIGIATVWGLYLLTRTLFNWQIAGIASFLMAVSFWHVNFSRIGFRAIMLPFILVWLFYFLWKGLRNSRFSDYAAAGLLAGLGFYTYISYRIAPLIIVILFIVYWHFLKKNFSLSEYEHAKNRLLQGFSLVLVVGFVVVIPLAWHFVANWGDVAYRQAQLSVFSQPEPFKALTESIGETLAMFTFQGDGNFRHNIPDSPMLPWPIGVFFAIGFLKELHHLLIRKHGHFSIVHLFLFAWFFVMLLPGFLSTESPHALRTIGVIPVAMIFSALGLWWFLDKVSAWHGMSDPAYAVNEPQHRHEGRIVLALTLIIFLAAIGFYEYNRYFRVWGIAPDQRTAFSAHLTPIANYINATDFDRTTFILVNDPGVPVNGISIFAEPIRFLTKTHSDERARTKNIEYVSPEAFDIMTLPRSFSVIPTQPSSALARQFSRLGLREKIITPDVHVFSR